jgi:uncharacterized membrane-anchored protein
MKLKLLILVLALQGAWLLGTVAVQEHALATGKVILLEARRVDPRDLLRGDYLILNYNISFVPTNLFSPPIPKDTISTKEIFVALAQGTNHIWEVTRASTNTFMPAADEVLLRGEVVGRGVHTKQIQVEYGLERFYVAEGTGNPAGNLTAQVVVPASGRGRVQEVFVDGKPYAEAMKGVER